MAEIQEIDYLLEELTLREMNYEEIKRKIARQVFETTGVELVL